MKSILNKAAHAFLKWTHVSVKYATEEHDTYVGRATEVQQEISDWLGNVERECIGLGQNCNASWYLKATGNKRASYPFDWIFTTPEIILDMLDDNFEQFLDRKQLIPHGMDAGHKRYHETLFGHRNPASSTEDHEFFKRCTVRWKDLMRSQRPVVFITVVLNEPDKRKRWKAGFTKQFPMPQDQKLKDFDGVMQKILSLNSHAKFLFIEQYTETPFELSVSGKNEHSFWLKFCSIDKNTGVQYLNKVDDEVMKTLYGGLTT